MGTPCQLLEFTQVSKAARIDEDEGVLYDLAALGPSSENGHDYPVETMRKALPLFEGRQAFANHTPRGKGDPSVYDVLGVWRNMRVVEGKVRGDFHYIKSHTMAPRLVEAARRPELGQAFGFSINGFGRKARGHGGRTVIESLNSLASIDLVSRPATLAGITESRSAMSTTVKQIIESLKSARPGYSRGLREAAEAGVLDPAAAMDEPPAVNEPAEETDHEQALIDAAKAVLEDSSLSWPEKIKKIQMIGKVIDAGNGGGSGGNGGGSDTPAEESLKLEVKALRLLGAKGVRLNPLVERAIKGCRTEADVKELVESVGAGDGRPGARSAAPRVPAKTAAGGKLQEAKDGGTAPDVPKGGAELGKWLKSGA